MDQESLNLELTKVEIDVVKHLSTLNTGVILVIGALLERLPKPLKLVYWLDAGIVLPLFSLLACVLYLTWNRFRIPAMKGIAGILFLLGVAGFVYFIEPNIIGR